MKHVMLVAGARPNFMKIAPLNKALIQHNISTFLVHTGQHYDPKMSAVFFKELGLPEPDMNLEIGPGDRREQTKKIIDGLVPILVDKRPDALIVVGDVTSTAAAAMAGIKAGVPVIHIEAGLRSFNWRMPEELNRMIADHHASQLFVHDPSGLEHLKNEGIPDERVYFVGNVMIDSLRQVEPLAGKSNILSVLSFKPGEYGLVTLHRPENVDDPVILKQLWEILQAAAAKIQLIFPIHPRTRSRLAALDISDGGRLRIIEPVGYIDMIALTKNAKFALTDSGGVQEETTALGIPCLTLREQTERPVTVTVGTSEVLGRDSEKILSAVDRVLRGEWKKGALPELWDGHASERIAQIIERL